MARRPQSHPTITSSDGVPPELSVLDLREFSACTGQTGRETGQTGPSRVFAVLIVLTIVARSSAFECVGANLCQHTFLATPLGNQINLVLKPI